MSNNHQESRKRNKWSKLKTRSLKILSGLAQNTIAKTLSGILLSLPFLKEIVERVSGLSIIEIMLHPLTTRIIPINPLSLLVALVTLALVYIAGLKYDRLRPRYYFHEEAGLYWKVDKKNRSIDETPYCPKHKVKLGKFKTIFPDLNTLNKIIPSHDLQCPHGHNVQIFSINTLDAIREKVKAKIQS